MKEIASVKCKDVNVCSTGKEETKEQRNRKGDRRKKGISFSRPLDQGGFALPVVTFLALTPKETRNGDILCNQHITRVASESGLN